MALRDKVKTIPIDAYEKKNKKFTQKDLAYMQSLSSAILQKAPVKSTTILWITFAVITWLIIWASFAEIDELTRGTGKVIPTHQVQIVQNLEGGIISEIMIQEGEIVKKGQILLKIDDTSFASSFQESNLRYFELKAKAARLLAESSGQPYNMDKVLLKTYPRLVKHESSLYNSNQEQLQQSLRILTEQVNQRQNELTEAEAKAKQLQKSYNLIDQELDITKPLLQKGLVSEVEYLQLKRQANSMYSDLQTVTLSIPRIKSTIQESKNKLHEAKLNFQNQAKKEYNEVTAEMDRIAESKTALKDRVERALVRSPVEGIVKQLLVNTVGGVVQPGMDLIEIVPLEDNLLIEAKVRPSDIAFLYPGQKAIVKFTAYDFAIHGGLQGKVTHISADTITDEEGENFFLVRVKTDKNYLGNEKNKLQIMVGMTTDIDILTGKKTVLDYLLKPIIKAKASALTEK